MLGQKSFLAVLLFIFITNFRRFSCQISQKVDKYVPGCASEQSFNFEEILAKNLTVDFLPSCFCDNATKDANFDTKFIKVSCYYSSTFDNLTETLQLVANSRKQVHQIYMANVEFTSEGIPDGYFERFGINTTEDISIVVCNGNDRYLKLNNASFRGLEKSLKRLKIYSCFLNQFPEAIRRLTGLEELILQAVYVQTLEPKDLAMLNNLRFLGEIF